MDAELLINHPLFTALPVSEIALLSDIMCKSCCLAGDILFQEGSSSDFLAILLEGEVEIIKSLGTSEERLVARRGKGTLLGEMSLFTDHGAHTASVRALGPLTLSQLSRPQFQDFLRHHPDLAYALLGQLSRRLEESENLTIQDLREKNQQLTRAYQDLKAAQAQLIEKKKLEHELEIASKLQASILPQKLPKPPGFDIGVLMEPANSVGGDFYDFIPLGADRIAIVVGDVCDKGIPAALFMTLTYALVRDEASHHRQPGKVLKAVNRRLVEINPTGRFVTLDALHDPRAHDLLEKGYRFLMARTEAIPDEATRRLFLTNVPSHRDLLAAWENSPK